MISDETPLIPEIAAIKIIAEAKTFCRLSFEGAEEYLCQRAEVCYAAGGKFRRLMRESNFANIRLFKYMRHWLAGWMIKAGHDRNDFPYGWTLGKDLVFEENNG